MAADMDLLDFIIRALIAGLAATAAMDLWQIVAKAAFGVPKGNWAMVGRWFAYLPRGVMFHDGIGNSEPVERELAIGWAAHYAVGILYAAIYLAMALTILDGPSLISAIAFSLFTILAGWCLLMPGMGLGWFASKAPNQSSTIVNGLFNHIVFGAGLYAGVIGFSAV